MNILSLLPPRPPFSYHVFLAYSPEEKAALSVLICRPVPEVERSVPLAVDAPFAI